MMDVEEMIARAVREADCRRDTPNERAWSADLARAALRALGEAGFAVVPKEPTPIWCSAVARSIVPKDSKGNADEGLVEAIATSICVAGRAMLDAAGQSK